MDDPWTGVTPREQGPVPEPRGPVYLLAEDAPLPEGVSEADEGVFVIRLVGPTPGEMEAHRAAMEAAENVAY